MSKIRVGAVSYLNTKPLVYGIDSFTDCDVTYDLPSRLADQLAAGQLDVALIPSIEAVVAGEYTIVSDACIACRGPVWSVKLVSRVPMNKIRSLALDEGSRTSAALAQSILEERFSLRPDLEPLKIDTPWQDLNTDAVLIIGDRAMQPLRSEKFSYEWDLGQYWNSWTQLPFVFAVWAARPGIDLNRIDKILTDCRDQGVANVNNICELGHERYGLTVESCHNYLSKNLHYFLGENEKAGLASFIAKAKACSLIPDHSTLEFYDCQTAG